MEAPLPTTEVAAPSRPFGLLLDDAGITAYADFFFPEELRSTVIERLKQVPRYSDGSARPQLWFRTKRDALQTRDILLCRAGRICADLRHR